jgi:hypothetical protein
MLEILLDMEMIKWIITWFSVAYSFGDIMKKMCGLVNKVIPKKKLVSSILFQKIIIMTHNSFLFISLTIFYYIMIVCIHRSPPSIYMSIEYREFINSYFNDNTYF